MENDTRDESKTDEQLLFAAGLAYGNLRFTLNTVHQSRNPEASRGNAQMALQEIPEEMLPEYFRVMGKYGVDQKNITSFRSDVEQLRKASLGIN